jgi:hypothetical protein
MAANPFIHIKSAKFPVLPEEDDELVNEGTYGKALAQYLESRLKDRGYDVPFICCEDWGWWVEIRGQPFALGLCVYGGRSLAEAQELCFFISMERGRRWSWTRFRFIDMTSRIDIRSLWFRPNVPTVGGGSPWNLRHSLTRLWRSTRSIKTVST